MGRSPRRHHGAQRGGLEDSVKKLTQDKDYGYDFVQHFSYDYFSYDFVQHLPQQVSYNDGYNDNNEQLARAQPRRRPVQ